MSDSSPSPEEIRALAREFAYIERRPEVSSTLFFKDNSGNSEYPTLINVFYTTRGVMTMVAHPTQGYNQLWRSHAYDSLETLAILFEDPRTHTGKGYRNKGDAGRGCTKCGEQKTRKDFSMNQWRLGHGRSKCTACIGQRGAGGQGGGARDSDVSELTRGVEEVKVEDSDDESFPTLTLDALSKHDQKLSKNNGGGKGKKKKGDVKLERRQFNCPLCPKEGRGKYLFFKRVPKMKPLVKCPKCKQANRGNCDRLYAIPLGAEKGYGLFRCNACTSTWGSQRTVAGFGQQCHACAENGNDNVMVKPFRIEVLKVGNKGIAGGGARMKRVPKEVIREGDVEEATYTHMDQQRNRFEGGNALVRQRGDDEGRSYDFVPHQFPDEVKSDSTPKQTKRNFQHKCEGCASGQCRSRKVPISEIHDVHAGDTVSTSASVVTDSEVDKSEFIDRDIDFDEWEDKEYEDDETEEEALRRLVQHH